MLNLALSFQKVFKENVFVTVNKSVYSKNLLKAFNFVLELDPILSTGSFKYATHSSRTQFTVEQGVRK